MRKFTIVLVLIALAISISCASLLTNKGTPAKMPAPFEVAKDWAMKFGEKFVESKTSEYGIEYVWEDAKNEIVIAYFPHYGEKRCRIVVIMVGDKGVLYCGTHDTYEMVYKGQTFEVTNDRQRQIAQQIARDVMSFVTGTQL